MLFRPGTYVENTPSILIGPSSVVTGDRSITIGHMCMNACNNSIVIGANVTAKQSDGVYIPLRLEETVVQPNVCMYHPGTKEISHTPVDLTSLLARITVLEENLNRPYVFACGSFTFDGTEAVAGQNFNISRVYLIQSNFTGEDGNYHVQFETPLPGGTENDAPNYTDPHALDYTIIIQPFVQNHKYHLVGDVTKKLPTGFSFRMSGTSNGTWDSFMVTCIRY